jgi:hypothetical protein
MQQTRRLGRLATRAAIAIGMVLAGTVPLAVAGESQAATSEALSVDLASSRGASTLVGEGVLYGINQDATLPADQFIQPLKINAFRGGGWFSGGWIKDNYQYGSATQADITSIIAQARRLNQVGDHPQYQVLLSDLYGLNAGQPSNTVYPCDNGNCSNWATFIDTTVAALQASGLPFAYDIDNEPDISVFWKAGVNSTQYFQMWDTAYRELRRVAPSVKIVGPSFAYTPQARPAQWSTFLNHVKAAGTVPDWITNHDEGDVDDPVAVSQALNSQLSAAGIAARPLSANEYQPADRQTAGVTAWYLARFAQSGYANAMRGNWVCCMTPNLTGILTQTNGTWGTSGNWWAMRSYADMTGTLVNTSGQVGSTAISASIDSTNRRAVAILGDSNGYTGNATVTFNGVSANSWLAGTGSVNVVVDRIPDQATLSTPQVVLNQTMTVSGGAITVPLTFQASHARFGRRSAGRRTGRRPVRPLCRRARRRDDQRHADPAVRLRGRVLTAVDLYLEQAAAGVRQQVPGRQRPGHRQRHRGDHLGLQRPGQPAVEPEHQRHDHRRAVGPVPGRQRGRDGQRHEAHPVGLQRRRQPAVEDA